MKHLLIQFHTDTISPQDDSVLTKYYNSIWEHEYYHKPDAFWELPKWAGELSHNLINANKEHEFMVLTEPIELNADIIFGSVLNINLELFKKLVIINWNKTFILGGYVNKHELDVFDNVIWFDSIFDYCNKTGIQYSGGVNWDIFRDEWCIPRITMSYGCKHRCKFCTIPNEIVEVPKHDIYSQVLALMPLKFNLVYIDDKTFGQCDNYRSLIKLEKVIFEFNKQFKGFVVQTTAPMVAKIDWTTLPVYAVEVGVETYNNSILKELRKPSSEVLVNTAHGILEKAGVKYIPNIVVGFLQENEATYSKTLNYIIRTNMLHANIYNLAIYDDADIAEDVNIDNSNDSSELESDKSYNSFEKNELNKSVIETMAQILLIKNNKL